MKKKEIYIPGNMAGKISGASALMREIAEKLFDGNLKDAAGLVKMCAKNPSMDWLLEEISYWDSEAGDVLGEGQAYKQALPSLQKYADKTGIYLRWKAYNEYEGLPIPEDDMQHEKRLPFD